MTNIRKIVAVTAVILFVFGILSSQQNLNVNKKFKRPTFQLKDRYIKGTVFEDAATGRNVRRHLGLFDSNCRKVYVSIPDSAPPVLIRKGFSKVKVRVSGAAYLRKNRATNSRNAIPSKSVVILREHQFEGTVTVISCNDGYFEMNYRMCDYGSFTVRVGLSSAECSRLNLSNGTRVRVTTVNWTYSPQNRLFTVNSILSLRKL